MKTFEVTSIGSPGIFPLSSGADNYHTERLSHNLDLNLASMASAGISYSMAEPSDFESFNSDWNQWRTDMLSYLDALDGIEEGGDMEALLVPAIPAIGAITLWLAKGAAMYLLAKIVTTIIDVGIEYAKRRLSTGTTLSIEAIIKKALLRWNPDTEDYESRVGDIESVIGAIETVVDIPGLRVWVNSAFAEVEP
jgi:hypothetical protein